MGHMAIWTAYEPTIIHLGGHSQLSAAKISNRSCISIERKDTTTASLVSHINGDRLWLLACLLLGGYKFLARRYKNDIYHS